MKITIRDFRAVWLSTVTTTTNSHAARPSFFLVASDRCTTIKTGGLPELCTEDAARFPVRISDTWRGTRGFATRPEIERSSQRKIQIQALPSCNLVWDRPNLGKIHTFAA